MSGVLFWSFSRVSFDRKTKGFLLLFFFTSIALHGPKNKRCLSFLEESGDAAHLAGQGRYDIWLWVKTPVTLKNFLKSW